MTEDEAATIAADLAAVVRSAQPAKIGQAFDALATLDACRIVRLARHVLDETDLRTLTHPGASAEEREHRATMDVFYGSMFAYFDANEDEIDASVEHDVPGWIEANVPALVSSNLRRMEAALPEQRNAHRNLVAFHQLVDLSAFEAQQNRLLQAAWADIESDVRARLAALGNEPPVR